MILWKSKNLKLVFSDYEKITEIFHLESLVFPGECERDL